jgi:hypothetical protein
MRPSDRQRVDRTLDYHAQTSVVIIGAGLANAITLLQSVGPFTLWNTIVGIIILCILHAYKPLPSYRFSLNLAYTATWSISFLTTFGVVYNVIYNLLGGEAPAYGSKLITPSPTVKSGVYTPFNTYDVWFFLVWLVLFLLFFVYFSFFSERGVTGFRASLSRWQRRRAAR